MTPALVLDPDQKEDVSGSDKTLEPFFCRFADRADSGRLVPGAEITADLAPPHRQREDRPFGR